MAGNRKAAQKFIIEQISQIVPSSENGKLYEDMFKGMSDREFDLLMRQLEEGTTILPLIIPNMNKSKLDTTRNIKLARKLGHEFYEQLWLTDPATGKEYLTPLKYMVVTLPLKRQSQLLTKKISLPDNNNHRDELTNQPTGPSKGSSLSFPETQLLFGLGMDRVIEELIKTRGGDEVAFNKMNKDIIDTGRASLDDIATLGSTVKSTETLSTLLKGMHLQNALV